MHPYIYRTTHDSHMSNPCAASNSLHDRMTITWQSHAQPTHPLITYASSCVSMTTFWSSSWCPPPALQWWHTSTMPPCPSLGGHLGGTSGTSCSHCNVQSILSSARLLSTGGEDQRINIVESLIGHNVLPNWIMYWHFNEYLSIWILKTLILLVILLKLGKLLATDTIQGQENHHNTAQVHILSKITLTHW